MKTSEFDLDSPAIRALGSLFKLTEVFLRDDGLPNDDNRQVSSCPKHIRFSYDEDDADGNDGAMGKISSVSSVETTEGAVLEDVDLFHEMSSLGLPLSFRTSKQSYAKTKGKHKPNKDQDIQSRLKDRVLVSPKLSEDNQSYAEFRDKSSNSSSLSLPDQAELSCSGFDVSYNTRFSNSCDRELLRNVPGVTGSSSLEFNNHENVPRNMSCEAFINNLLGTDIKMENKMSIAATSNLLERNRCGEGYRLDDCVKEHPEEMNRSLVEPVDTNGAELNNAMQLDDLDSSMCIEQTQVAGMPIDSYMVLDPDAKDNTIFSAACGEWSAFWDSFYMRYYFYNTKTKESTWYPPLGMESFANYDVSVVFDESSLEVVGTNGPAFSQNEEQLDRHELVDKAHFDEQTGDTLWDARNLATADLSYGSAVLSDTPCAVNSYDQHMLDGNCQDEITYSSSPPTFNYNHSPKDGREQEDSAGLCSGWFPANKDDSVGNPCENANGNYNGNLRAQLSNARSLSSLVEAVECGDVLINHVNVEELETVANGFRVQDTPAATTKKTKRKNRRRKKSFKDNDDREFLPVEESYVDITKYWCQRYLLFSKFDDGIQMDEEGWFSVTPEAIARHHASRCDSCIVIDCFTGVGGNAIQFAKMSKHVIAIDIDPNKIDYAHHNAAIYGVEDRIDFVNGDSFSVAPMLKADTVFLSPPWGGPDYLKVKSYDITMLQPYDGQFLFDTFNVTASQIIMFLPRNVDIVQLAELTLSANSRWSLEVERNFLNGKLKAVTAYFSKIS